MPAPLRIVVAAAVLTVGIACAALFRRDQSNLPQPTSSRDAESTSGTVELGPINPPQSLEQMAGKRQSGAVSPSHFMIRPLGSGSDGEAARTPTAAGPAQTAPHRSDDPPSPRPSSRPAVPSIPSMAPTFPGASDLRPSRVGDLPPSWSRRPDQRLHRVSDGDTLESIAEQYFGSVLHAEDIRRANSETLPNPNVLPIGIELVIPNLSEGGPATIDAAPPFAPKRNQSLDAGEISKAAHGTDSTPATTGERSNKPSPKPAAEPSDRPAAMAWPSSDRRDTKATPPTTDGWEPAER